MARHDTRVVFVRHGLTGERVRAVVTEGHDRSSFWRADVVEVLVAAPERVTPPCRWAGPGLCGGCDWQHVDLAAQRTLKAEVVREQLTRLGRLDLEALGLDVRVESVPGDDEGLGWRTRVQYAVDAAGAAGLRKHRSHEVVRVDRCLIAHPLVEAAEVTGRTWPGVVSVDVAVSPVTGERLVLPGGAGGASRGPARDSLTEVVGERSFRVSGGGFWQVHPGAAAALTDAVLDGLEPRSGETALDLYGGVGLFAAALADRVAPGGRVTLVESDRVAVADARHNLAGRADVSVEQGRVDHVLGRLRTGRADLVVLDPPRSGAGRAVVDLLSRVRARRIAYVACDPAALARDLRWFTERGHRVTGLRAFDLFPMTSHVECLAVLEPDRG